MQHHYSRIGGAVAYELRRRRLPIFSYPHFTRPGGMSRTFNQCEAVYHQCGAMPLLVEFPNSLDDHSLSFDQILDVGLAFFEALLVFGNDLGYRPTLRKHLADGRMVSRYGKLNEQA